MSQRSSSRRPSAVPGARRGFTLLEMVVAAALLLVAMTLTVRLVGWMAAERLASSRRMRAVQEVANLMERLTAADPAELTPERLEARRLSPEAARALPGGELNVAVEDAEAGLRRIRVELSWRDRSGTRAAPVRLTSWIAPEGRAGP